MRNKDARILIAGSYGHGNTGDEAILAAIVNQLRARMPEARLVVVAGDTEAIRRQFGVETLPWSDWAAIAQAVQQSDAVIQGGGGIFFDYTGFHPWDLFENGAPDLAHYGGFSLLAELYGKPFMVYGVGVGPLFTEGGRQMVRLAHSLAGKITVRDAESKSLLEEIGVKSNRVEITVDPAFALQPTDPDRARKILSYHGINLGQSVIAVTARPWSYAIPQPGWEDSLADAVSAFASRKQAQVLLIPFHKGYDDAPILRIRELLAENETFVLRSGYTPQEVAGVIGVCDLLVGLRLHSILFAILTATPAVALAYDPKVRSLVRRIGHEDICIDLTDLSQLKNLLASVWERREELSRDFARACAEMRLISERNGDLACELLNARVPNPASGTEFRDIFAKAFYGRLQAIRSRDRRIAKHEEASDLREIIGIMNAEQWPLPSPPSEMADSKGLQPLREFLEGAVTESTERLVLIYRGNGTTGLGKAFADYGVPTIFICEVEEAATQEQGGKVFQLPVASMVASWDEVLYVSTPRSCQKVLLLRSVDQNTFRLINHAHARGWVTIYYPDQYERQAWHDPEAERYVVSNVEYVIVGSESLKKDMQSIGAQEVQIITEDRSGKSRAEEILALVAKPIPKSPVRLAIEGASHA